MKVFVGAVCVAFNPSEGDFLQTIDAALAEVECLVVVNNGEQPLSTNIDNELHRNLYVIENGDNLGVAQALNIGIDFLITQNCSHFLLLDQDSIVPKGMVSALLNDFDELKARDINVAAVGPCFFNPKLGEVSPFTRFKNVGVKKIYGNNSEPLVSVHILITSGTLVKVEAIHDVGIMEPGLFIDYVDTEWCLRALAKGYALYGDSRVVMNHELGDDAVVFFKKKIFGHSPLRHYYMARNLIHLMRRPYIPFNWKLTLFLGMTKVLIFYSLIPKDRLVQFRKIVVGFYHGILGKYGRFDLLF